MRLSQSASLELQRGKTRITLLKDGTYEMAAVSKATDKTATGGSGNAIAQKLQSLTTEKPKTATAAGGVRGADQGSVSVTWADESDETRTQVQALLDQKKYADAVKMLNQAISDSSVPSEKSEFTYLKAVAYYGDGQAAQSYRTLARVAPPARGFLVCPLHHPEGADTRRHAELQGRPCVPHALYRADPKGEATQVAYLLSAYCDKGLGDPGAERCPLTPATSSILPAIRRN